MQFDLQSLDLEQACEQGFAHRVYHPATGEPLGPVVHIRGREAPSVRQHVRRRNDELMRRELEARRRNRPTAPLSEDEEADLDVELAVLCTLGWEGFAAGGAAIAFSAEAARAVYRKHRWLRDQVIAEANALKNFATGCSTSSTSTPAPNSPST